MSQEMSDRRGDATATRELVPAPQIQAFVEEHPLLSIAFMVALGYAAGRIISKL
jgi:hypothetical protein